MRLLLKGTSYSMNYSIISLWRANGQVLEYKQIYLVLEERTTEQLVKIASKPNAIQYNRPIAQGPVEYRPMAMDRLT